MVFGRKFSRGKKGREALLRSLVRSIVTSNKIVTTHAKAKGIQAQLDKLVTLAKKGTLSARRQILAYVGNDKKTTDTLVNKIVPSFGDRTSGFTRITRLPVRLGDGAEMARLEWVEAIKEVKIEKEVKAEKKQEKPAKKVTVKKVITSKAKAKK
jgi:large subunit ribosomal protein L17